MADQEKCEEGTTLRPVDGRCLTRVARSIGQDWRWLGRNLDIENEKLDAIEQDYKYEGCNEMAYRTLSLWKSRSPEMATINILAQHLRSMDHADIANIIDPENKDQTPVNVERKSNPSVLGQRDWIDQESLKTTNKFHIGGKAMGSQVVQYGDGSICVGDIGSTNCDGRQNSDEHEGKDTCSGTNEKTPDNEKKNRGNSIGATHIFQIDGDAIGSQVVQFGEGQIQIGSISRTRTENKDK